MDHKAAVIIPAAGSGTRMKLNHPKQYHQIAGAPILVHTLQAFLACPFIGQLIVVVPADKLEETPELLNEFRINDPRVSVIAGGKRRQDSVFEGLMQVKPEFRTVLVHDGARPLIQQQLIENIFKEATAHGAAIAAIPVKDTLKKGDENHLIAETISRDNLWHAQTPQAAHVGLLKKAYAENGDNDVTDEASLLENAKIPVILVEGSETNIKVTRPEDLHIAEKFLNNAMKPTFRIGHGFDAHRFAEDRKLVLGGVTIPHTMGLAGHSDADVLTHAVCDALLGAIGAGDIGKHFPDSSAEFKDIYSITLLERVVQDVQAASYEIANMDITVVCQAPKLAAHIPEMVQTIAKATNTAPEQINIKATTTEKMGYTGRKEGISAHAVALLQTS